MRAERRSDAFSAASLTPQSALNLCHLLESLGFEKRVSGSHHVFRKIGVEERINLQRAGANAKAYQVKQVRSIIFKARLGFPQ